MSYRKKSIKIVTNNYFPFRQKRETQEGKEREEERWSIFIFVQEKQKT